MTQEKTLADEKENIHEEKKVCLFKMKKKDANEKTWVFFKKMQKNRR